ncbi:MAG: ATP-binding protein [Verrucomicrobiota bacterium]|jgi:signal transduction histidine kinase
MVVVLALALMLLIGCVDYATGHDIALGVVYLAPVCWATWEAGRRSGIVLAITSGATWLIADLMSGYPYLYVLIPYWNALMLSGFFLIVVFLLTALQGAEAHLEETVRLRTEELKTLQGEVKERQRLEAANLQAERLSTVGKMAAQVAHEVRNPLGSITLNLDLIQKEIDRLVDNNRHSPNEGRVLIRDMREEVCRIGRVIEDYLQFARLPKPHRQPLALNAFLDQKLAFLCTELEQGKVKLRTHFDPAPITINADADQLWQALLNLIRNSCEAMPGGGELSLGTRRKGKEGLLLVTDSGKGMTEEQRQQVFVPFFTTKEKGIGLGMTLVHQIVTEHGGRIECESTSGKGSTFTLIFPLVEKP